MSQVDMSVGDAVEVAVQDGALIVTPVRRVRGALDLEELVSSIPKDYKTEELDWVGPVGAEVW